MLQPDAGIRTASEHVQHVRLNAPPDLRMFAQSAGKSELDGPPQETGQEALEAGEVDQSEPGVRIDLDQQIHVARRPRLAAGGRTEQRQTGDAARPDVRGVGASSAMTRSRSASWLGNFALAVLDMPLKW